MAARTHATEPLGRPPGVLPDICVSAVLVSSNRESPGQSLARAQVQSGGSTSQCRYCRSAASPSLYFRRFHRDGEGRQQSNSAGGGGLGSTGPLAEAHNYAVATVNQPNRPVALPRGSQDGYKRFQQPAWEARRTGPAQHIWRQLIARSEVQPPEVLYRNVAALDAKLMQDPVKYP